MWSRLLPGENGQSLLILSSSLDFCVGIWIYDKKNNLWDKKYSLGEIISNKHAFFNVTFLSSYKEVLSYSYHKSLYYWEMNNEGKYETNPAIHVIFEEVTDIRWDPSKNLFFSCSHDETIRFFRIWEKNKTRNDVNRPQISGYLVQSFLFVEYSKNNKGEQAM